MSASYILQAFTFIALAGFSLYMAQQNKDNHLRKKWKNIIAVIVLIYFAGKLIEELNMNMFPG